MTSFRLTIALAVGVFGLLIGTRARAGVVKGVVVLPEASKGPSERMPSFWPRIENGILQIAPPLVSAFAETVVVLEGGAAQTGSGTVSMEVAGSDLSPRIVPILAGTTVEFHNGDRLAYSLFSPDNASFFAKEETAAGKSRKIKFLAPGAYLVRCAEFPHIEGAVLVLAGPHSARPDERGGFKIEGVAEGKYTLKVFFHDAFVTQQPLEVGSKPIDVTVKVPAPAPRQGD